jgi:hypothetical protein
VAVLTVALSRLGVACSSGAASKRPWLWCSGRKQRKGEKERGGGADGLGGARVRGWRPCRLKGGEGARTA